MACLVKILLAFFIVQVAVVLAKPYEQENDDVLYRSQSDTGACSMNPADRVDCGYVGITKSGCEQKGCCYDNSVSGGVPWCFNAKRDCSNNPADRVDCGHGGITKSGCEQKGCCYDNSVSGGVPWCFHAKVKPPESCSFAAKDRKDCGPKYKGECELKGCCWDSSVRGRGVPWCFKPADCGSKRRLGFEWSQRCRTSCREGERREAGSDFKCSGNDVCCKCHNGWYWDCELDF